MSNRAPCHHPGLKGAHVTKPIQTWDSIATLCNSHRNCLGLRRSSWISDPPKQFSFWYSCCRSIGNPVFGFIFLLFVTGQQLAPWNITHTTVLHEISHIPPCSRNHAHTTVLLKSSAWDRAPHIRSCFTKKRTLCFLGWILWRMNVGGEWGIQEFRSIYAVFCEITHTTVLRTVFDQNQKNKSSLGFCWRMVASVGKYWASTLNITLFVALNCAWWKRSKRDPKEIQIQSCSTHTTVLHTYDRAPHIRPCSTKGVLPEIFWGTIKLAFFLGSGDRCIRWKWDGTYCWLELSSNNFGEFRKQFCIKFGLKHGQLWGLAIFRLDMLITVILRQLSVLKSTTIMAI